VVARLADSEKRWSGLLKKALTNESRAEKLTPQEIRILCVISLLIGAGTLYLGVTGGSAGPASIVGQPPTFNQFKAEVDAGLVMIGVSAIGLALSFRKSKNPRSETARLAT
jgi:hypothetical protein